MPACSQYAHPYPPWLFCPRLLWHLGERSRALVGMGFKHAAVYVHRTLPQPADTAAAGEAAAEAAQTTIQQ